MATKVTAFADKNGMLHSTAEKATIADIMTVVGNGALATTVLQKRKEIEALFAAHDAMNALQEGSGALFAAHDAMNALQEGSGAGLT